MSARWSLWAAALLLGYCHRVLHPEDAPECWPDGGPVIYDATLEPEDFCA